MQDAHARPRGVGKPHRAQRQLTHHRWLQAAQLRVVRRRLVDGGHPIDDCERGSGSHFGGRDSADVGRSLAGLKAANDDGKEDVHDAAASILARKKQG